MHLNFDYRSAGNIETDGLMVFVSSDELGNFARQHDLSE